MVFVLVGHLLFPAVSLGVPRRRQIAAPRRRQAGSHKSPAAPAFSSLPLITPSMFHAACFRMWPVRMAILYVWLILYDDGAATPACDCLGPDPCMAVDGGECLDANIGPGVLTCSLDP